MPKKPFVKGDPRINRKGRPRSFDALRALAQEIAHETVKNHGVDLVIDGRVVTVAEAILRQWAKSSNPQLVKSFIEIAFGKVPNEIELKSKQPLMINVEQRQKAIAQSLKSKDDIEVVNALLARLNPKVIDVKSSPDA